MSESVFNFNLERVRKIRAMKGANLQVVVDSRFPHIHGRPLFLSQDGTLTTDILDADFDSVAKEAYHIRYKLYDYDLESYAKNIMTENEKYMQHLSYHPDDWAHVD